MDILVGFYLDREIHKKFKAKVAELGLTQKEICEKLIVGYVKNG